MKKKLAFLIFFISVCGFSQRLDFDQYVGFLGKDIFYVQGLLLSKNWEIHSFDKENKTVSFLYKHKGIIQELNTFNCNKDNTIYSILSMVHSKTKYNAYINRLGALGYKLTKEKFEDGETIKIYDNANDSLLRVRIYKNEKNTTFYDFFLIRQ